MHDQGGHTGCCRLPVIDQIQRLFQRNPLRRILLPQPPYIKTGERMKKKINKRAEKKERKERKETKKG